MQVLATRGTEFHLTHGFDVVHGVVTRLDVATEPKPLLLPHMGWNDVRPPSESVLFKGIDVDDPSFYFVLSFALQSNDAGALFSYCEYGKRFIAAAEKGCVFGVQFHPEKSQRNGHRLIANFLGFTNG
jgi:glutamine amidotransferase